MTRIVDRGTLMTVLDHGFVRLIDYMGKDENIVEAARMSTGKGFISWDPYERCDKCELVGPIGSLPVITNSRIHRKDMSPCGKITEAPNGDVGLMDTLYRKKHATPFEMGELVIEVQAPIFVFREWHRHRTQSYNEFSARYAMMPNLHYLPELNRFQKQSTANKQGSAEAMEEVWAHEARKTLEQEQQLVYDEYEHLVGDGLAKEVARINTPVSRYSKMRAKGNLRNWFQFLNLRMRPDAQYEIRQYAEEVGKMISWLWPKAYSLFEEYDLYGAHFSRSELKTLRELLSIDGGSDMLVQKDIAKGHGVTGSKFTELMAKLEFGGEKIL